MTTHSQHGDHHFISYSFPFLFLGLFLFLIVQGCLILLLPALINGSSLQSPVILGGIHLFILGFATTIAMGAMIQLVPVALQTKLISYKLIPYHFAIYLIGFGGLIVSFESFQLILLIAFGCLTLIGLMLFEINLLPAVLKAAPSPLKWGICSALLYLLLTVILGVTMLIDFKHSFLGIYHEKLFAVHVLFGLLGWFTLLIISFSYKLLPMFSLSHNYESKWAGLSIYFINLGILVLTLGFLFTNVFTKGLGGLVILFGLFSYAKQLSLILKKRLRKKLDVGVKSSLYAWPFTLLSSALGYGLSLMLHKAFPMGVFMYSAIMGWIGLVILGYLHKIIPFLWWTFKYSSDIGQRKVPALGDLISEKWGGVWIIGVYLFTLFNILFLSVGAKWCLTLSQGVIFFISLLYVSHLMKSVFYKPMRQ
ncbi:membrane protein [Pullulanibacillus camelliae]|uniref:Membrane protein n=1 Tax=Pullulanibacillus camelliae TaxID=1707096 RepID=A0A8J2YHX9_9BACL|nr:hypothetical protein [Pullulanibacillus camelliae]GGE43913.1 membrane protein [Pullulanibacillus camelliae]